MELDQIKLDRKAAIILAAGQSRRMNSSIQKQYMDICGRPLIYYSLKAFQESSIDEIILVTGEEEVTYCKEEIVKKYGFTKVSNIVKGGRERYHSVYAGLKALKSCSYVLIHDGARPLISNQIIEHTMETVQHYKACAVGMPVKDTIKIVEEGFIASTPERSSVWTIQTPQAFSYALIWSAYDRLFTKGIKVYKTITDDAMVVELMTQHRIKLIEGSYKNIKVTTPEDIGIAELLFENIESD